MMVTWADRIIKSIVLVALCFSIQYAYEQMQKQMQNPFVHDCVDLVGIDIELQEPMSTTVHDFRSCYTAVPFEEWENDLCASSLDCG
jgi:hypothetical protein